MSTEKNVYDNGLVLVSVKFFPPEASPFYIARVECIPHPPTGLSHGALPGWLVSRGNEIVTKTEGALWWRRKIITSKTTEEERLRDAVIRAVEYADNYKRRFLEERSRLEEALEDADRMIQALREVGVLPPQQKQEES